MAKTNYPGSVKGIHYRISNGYRYLTVSLVLEKNLAHPELGFNFAETQGQGIVHSSQLCFLTKEDAVAFLDTYGGFLWNREDYRPFVSRGFNHTLIRIDAGGNIPCYTSKANVEYYSNRMTPAMQERIKEKPVLNPFIEQDPNLKSAAEKDKAKREAAELQDQIIKEVLEKINPTKINARWGEDYVISLKNVDDSKWQTFRDSWEDKINISGPYMIFKVAPKGMFGYNKELYLYTVRLEYKPLASLFKKEVKKTVWDSKQLNSFWKILIDAVNRELASSETGFKSSWRDYIGIESEGYRFDEWKPGKKNNAEKIVADIQADILKIEKATKLFEEVANNFDEEETIE